MLSKSIALNAILLSCTASVAHGQNASPTKLPFADAVVQSYSDGQDPVTKEPLILHWGDLKPDDFGPRSITFSDTGIRQLRPVPAPGVHPRILFTPDDLPDLRRRMKETKSGKIMYNRLLSFSHALRGDYDENAAYAKPDLWKGGYRGSHGNAQIWYYHDRESQLNPANHTFAKLMAGNSSIDPKNLWPLFAIDALRCLIDDDQKGAQQLAVVVNSAMLHDQAARATERAAKGIKTPLTAPVSGGAGGQDFGYLYDFLYNWLTPEQKKSWHAELASSTWSHDNYGTFNAAVATRSNWATFTYWLIPLLAIEGEAGYNELKAKGIYRGYRDFLTYGIFPDGAYVEGEAKDQLGGDGLVSMAMRRQPNLFAHPYLQAYAKDFLPHSVVPNTEYQDTASEFGAGPFVKFDLLGGMGMINISDALTLKYMFPQDKIIDWVYRNEVGENYEHLPKRGISGYWDDVLLGAVFATDFDAANNDPAKLGLGLTYFSGERAMMLTRSDWSKDALMLAMHTRELNGGHPFADRNAIFLFAKGRSWITLNQRDGDDTAQSEVVIDRKPQSANSPGRMVDYVNAPMATFSVGDAKYAWDWDEDILSYGSGYTAEEIRARKVEMPKGGWEPEMHSINDFAYTRLPEEYANAPLFHLHGWIARDGRYTPMARKQNYPVLKAFRTAGIVRGEMPYSLIVDDIQKDNASHHYDWQVLLDKDLGIVKVTPLDGGSGVMDVVLAAGGKLKKGDAALLIRVLHCSPEAAKSVHAALLQPGDPRGDKKRELLLISADAIAPDFKVLLLPYREGESLPATEWNEARSEAVLHFGQTTDTIRFSKPGPGKTDIRIVRSQDGHTATLIEVNKPVAALPVAAPSSALTQFP